MFVPYGSETWTKSYCPNYTKFWTFSHKKTYFCCFVFVFVLFLFLFLFLFFIYNHFLTEMTPFWKTLLQLKLLFMLHYQHDQFKDYHLSAFQKLRHSDTCNQVKSCTKHGRPDQSQRELTVALKIQYNTFRSVGGFKNLPVMFINRIHDLCLEHL